MIVRRLIVLSLMLLVLGVAGVVADEVGDQAGTAFYVDPALGDRLDPRGEPVTFGRTLITYGKSAIVHLDNGRVVKIAANSAARFSEIGEATIEMTVYTGWVSTVGMSGRVLRVGGFGSVELTPRVEDVAQIEDRLLLAGSSGGTSRSGASRRRD